MSFLGMVQSATGPGTWGPPAAQWFDNFFGYGVLVLLITMVVWSSMKDQDPPPKG